MAFLVAFVVGFTILEGTWRWVVIVMGVAIEIVEAFAMIRLSRRRRPAVGSEAFVGRRAVVATPCLPDGQVRIDGEIWAARAPSRVPAGAYVRIVGVDGLTLLVEPDEED